MPAEVVYIIGYLHALGAVVLVYLGIGLDVDRVAQQLTQLAGVPCCAVCGLYALLVERAGKVA